MMYKKIKYIDQDSDLRRAIKKAANNPILKKAAVAVGTGVVGLAFTPAATSAQTLDYESTAVVRTIDEITETEFSSVQDSSSDDILLTDEKENVEFDTSMGLEDCEEILDEDKTLDTSMGLEDCEEILDEDKTLDTSMGLEDYEEILDEDKILDTSMGLQEFEESLDDSSIPALINDVQNVDDITSEMTSEENIADTILTVMQSSESEEVLLSALTAENVTSMTGLSQEQIVALYEKYLKDSWNTENTSIFYDPYFNTEISENLEEIDLNGVKAQILKEDSIYRADILNLINFIRELCGLNTVTYNQEYNGYSQAGVEYLAENNLSIDHYAAYEWVFDDDGNFVRAGAKEGYEDADKGLRGSNLAQGNAYYTGLNDLVLSFFSDDDASNRLVPGHRYWILDPTLQEIGIGFVQTSSTRYLAVYVNGSRDSGTTGTDIIHYAYPNAGTCPYEVLDEPRTSAQNPWTIEVDDSLTLSDDFGIVITDDSGHTYEITYYDEEKAETVKNYKFLGDWYTSTTYYGESNGRKITFNPGSLYKDYIYGENGYYDLVGHTFKISMSGLIDENGVYQTIEYEINFISMVDLINSLEIENQQEIIDQAQAKIVMDMIDSIGEVTLETSLYDVESAFDALTEEQKELVLNSQILTDAQTKLIELKAEENDLKAAQPVIDMINGISEVTKDSDFSLIDEAYSLLSDDQKTMVLNYSQLEKAKEEKTALIKSYDDQQKADVVIKMIDKIKNVSKDSSFEDIDLAYAALTADQQDLVTNLNKLEEAKEEVKKLNIAYENKKAADEVITLINTLDGYDEEIDLDKTQDAIKKAQDAYNALTDEQKELVYNLADLKIKEDNVNSFVKNKEAANAVNIIIDDIPGEVSLSDKGKIIKARQAYDDLEDKSFIDSTVLLKLTDAEAQLAALEKTASDTEKADQVIDMILDLPPETFVEWTDEGIIEEVREAYNLLTDEQKALVYNYHLLVQVENELQDVKSQRDGDIICASEVLNLINLLNDIPTLADGPEVIDAANRYNNLTDAQKEFIPDEKYERLVKIVNAYNELKAEYESNLNNALEAQNAISDIPSLITLESRSAIENARTIYNALNEIAKEMVDQSFVQKLEQAEIAIEELNNESFDKAKADDIASLIDDIPEIITYENADQIALIKEKYDELTDNQKKYICDESKIKLSDANIKVNQLILEHLEDLNAVAAFEDKIYSLPDNLTYEYYGVISEISQSYNNLSKTQQDIVSEEAKDILKKAISEMNALVLERKENISAAKYVVDLITAIPDEVVLSNESQVNFAETKYLELTDEQKTFVEDFVVDKLTRVKSSIESLKTDYQAQTIIDVIMKIPDFVSEEDEESIKIAIGLFESASDDVKTLVLKKTGSKLANSQKLLDVVKNSAFNEKTANAVVEKLLKLPAVQNLQLSDRETVLDVKSAYDELTQAQKFFIHDDYVNALNQLVSRMYELEAIEVEREFEYLPEDLAIGDKITVIYLKDKINSLSENARAAFDKDLLTTLEVAEETIAKLEQDKKDEKEISDFNLYLDLVLEHNNTENANLTKSVYDTYLALPQRLKSKVAQEKINELNDLAQKADQIKEMQRKEQAKMDILGPFASTVVAAEEKSTINNSCEMSETGSSEKNELAALGVSAGLLGLLGASIAFRKKRDLL